MPRFYQFLSVFLGFPGGTVVKSSPGNSGDAGDACSILKKGSAKECSGYRTIALISNASKVMLKILQARLQQYMNREPPDVHGSRTAEAWLGEF